MRGEGAPSPIYEGEDSVIARILDGKEANYKVPLPKKSESKKAILETINSIFKFKNPFYNLFLDKSANSSIIFTPQNLWTGNSDNGRKITEELDRADAHPYGARPFKRQNYINKFLTLTENILDKKESDRFLKTVQNLRNLKSGQLHKLNIEVRKSKLKQNNKKGIF